MKIDEAKKNLKSRLTDNSFLTKNSQEAINFIEGYMLLLEVCDKNPLFLLFFAFFHIFAF